MFTFNHSKDDHTITEVRLHKVVVGRITPPEKGLYNQADQGYRIIINGNKIKMKCESDFAARVWLNMVFDDVVMMYGLQEEGMDNELSKRFPEVLKNIPEEQLRTLPYFKNRGIMFLIRAFISDDQGDRDRHFSDAIKEYHESYSSSFLQGVCESDRDFEVAFTVFQWLSTNIGGSVLVDALKRVGKVIVNREK